MHLYYKLQQWQIQNFPIPNFSLKLLGNEDILAQGGGDHWRPPPLIR